MASASDDRLIDILQRVSRIEARQVALADAEDDKADLLRLTIREAVREGLEPVSSRVDALEADLAKAVNQAKAGAAILVALAGCAAWAVEHLPKFLPLLFVATTAVGCAQPVTIAVDPNLDPRCVAYVEGGIAFWEELGAPLVRVERVSGADIRIRTGDIEPGVVGREISGRIVLDPEKCNVQTTAHEIGHSLGLDHRNVEGALMHKYKELGGWGLTGAELDQARDP